MKGENEIHNEAMFYVDRMAWFSFIVFYLLIQLHMYKEFNIDILFGTITSSHSTPH